MLNLNLFFSMGPRFLARRGSQISYQNRLKHFVNTKFFKSIHSKAHAREITYISCENATRKLFPTRFFFKGKNQIDDLGTENALADQY